MTAEDPRTRSRRLDEAGAIWREVGNPLGEAKVDLVRASIDRGAGSAALRQKAERELEALGARAHQSGNVAAGLLAALSPRDRAAVRIQSLGGFSVMRDGELVRISEWQSKRARELLKLLIARRGRPATRSYLMETLWPGEDPDRVANRLSVALTTVRGVLDPERRFPPEHFVVGDKDAVALNLDAVDIDVERFLSATADGLDCVRRADIARGLGILSGAAAVYAGEFLEENPYDGWAVPLREEARAAYVAALRLLARHAADPDTAVHPSASHPGDRSLRRRGSPRPGARPRRCRASRRGPPSLPELPPRDGRSRRRTLPVPGRPQRQDARGIDCAAIRQILEGPRWDWRSC